MDRDPEKVIFRTTSSSKLTTPPNDNLLLMLEPKSESVVDSKLLSTKTREDSTRELQSMKSIAKAAEADALASLKRVKTAEKARQSAKAAVTIAANRAKEAEALALATQIEAKKARHAESKAKSNVANVLADADISKASAEFEELMGLLKTITIKDISDLVPVVIPMMDAAAEFKKLKGFEKKKLIITVVLKCIKESDDLDDTTKTIIFGVAEKLLPSIVDGLFSANQGLHKFKKKTRKCVFGCLGKK